MSAAGQSKLSRLHLGNTHSRFTAEELEFYVSGCTWCCTRSRVRRAPLAESPRAFSPRRPRSPSPP